MMFIAKTVVEHHAVFEHIHLGNNVIRYSQLLRCPRDTYYMCKDHKSVAVM